MHVYMVVAFDDEMGAATDRTVVAESEEDAIKAVGDLGDRHVQAFEIGELKDFQTSKERREAKKAERAEKRERDMENQRLADDKSERDAESIAEDRSHTPEQAVRRTLDSQAGRGAPAEPPPGTPPGSSNDDAEPTRTRRSRAADADADADAAPGKPAPPAGRPRSGDNNPFTPPTR